MSRAVGAVRRLVVKVGTSSLVDDRGRALSRKLAKVARDVASVRKGRDCVLVSSGAIASGLGPMGLSRRPRDIPGLQAAAAVGQGRLMAEYARRFARRGVVTAQVLLTQEDFLRRRHFINARNTFERLMDAGIVPVVNENAPWPHPRSPLETTIAWPRWWPSWSAPICSCCSRTSTGSSSETPAGVGPGCWER